MTHSKTKELHITYYICIDLYCIRSHCVSHRKSRLQSYYVIHICIHIRERSNELYVLLVRCHRFYLCSVNDSVQVEQKKKRYMYARAVHPFFTIKYKQNLYTYKHAAHSTLNDTMAASTVEQLTHLGNETTHIFSFFLCSLYLCAVVYALHLNTTQTKFIHI